MRRLFGLGGVLAVGLTAAAADAAKPTPADLVKQLSDARFTVRQSAERELLLRGPDALPALRAALAVSPDAELRERAETVLDQIARDADSARLIAAKSVKVEYRNQPLAAVLADLKTKTGVNLTISPGKVVDATRTVTAVSDRELPAWEAVEFVLKAAGLREEFRYEPAVQTNTSYYGGGRRIYYAGNPSPPPSAAGLPVYVADGPWQQLSGSRETGVRVLVMPGRFPGNKVVRGAGRLIVMLDVTPISGIAWGEVSAVRVTAAEDEDGRPLFPDLKPPTDATSFNNYNQWNRWGGMWLDEDMSAAGPANPRLVPVALRTNDKAFKTLRRFEGVVVGELNQPNMPLVTVPRLADAVGRPPQSGPDDLKVAVNTYTTDAKTGATVVKVRVEVLQQWVIQQRKQAARNGGAQQVFWGGGWTDGFSTMPQQLQFADAAGKPVPLPNARNSSSTSDGWRQSMEVEYHFPKSDKYGPPVSLVYRGTKPTPVEVPFRATNVAVP